MICCFIILILRSRSVDCFDIRVRTYISAPNQDGKVVVSLIIRVSVKCIKEWDVKELTIDMTANDENK